MEEQPWIWNDMKLAGALRKFNSILDVGVIDEDNEDDVDEASCIDAETVEIRTRTRLGVKREDKAVPAQPLLPWQDR